GPGQGVVLPARAQRPLDGGERAALGFPGGAVRVAALDLQRFLFFHPTGEGALDVRPVAGDDARRRQPVRSDQPGAEAARDFDDGARALLEQRLPQVRRRDPDILAEGDQLVLGEPLADVALGSLELRRPLNDALQRLATDQLLAHPRPWPGRAPAPPARTRPAGRGARGRRPLPDWPPAAPCTGSLPRVHRPALDLIGLVARVRTSCGGMWGATPRSDPSRMGANRGGR